jgi:hypothetical protein
MRIDTMGDTFRLGGLEQRTLSPAIPTPPSAFQTPPGVSPYPTDQTFQDIDTTNDWGTLSQETILKIQDH